MPHQKSPKKKQTGIILSGGNSTRFQRQNKPWLDKALISFNGEILLQKTIRMLSDICDKIIIMVKFEDRKTIYQEYVNALPTTINSKVLIEKDNGKYLCNGPTLGIISSLPFIEGSQAIVVPVDLPLMKKEILIDLLNRLDKSNMVIPFWSDTGKIEPLVFTFKVKPIENLAKILSQIKRSRADDLHRAILNTKFLAISSGYKKEIEEIFTSINDQIRYEEVSKSKPVSIANYFEPQNSITISGHINELLLTRVESFLLKYNFVKPEKKIVTEVTEISKELVNQELFFLAGILLFNFISKIKYKETNFDNDSLEQLIELCYSSFRQEASIWQKRGIYFLALHSLSDAALVSKMFNLPEHKHLEIEINELKELLDLKKKKHLDYSLDSLFEKEIPLFLEQAKEIIQKSEKLYNEETPSFPTNFLWDHSFRVGKIAYKLAIDEGVDPLIPTIAAILHDAGKFVFGKYHHDEVTEEEHSSSIAQRLLKSSQLSHDDIVAITAAINALYNEKFECGINCKIVHDADRLEKLGPLGIANFFTKMTLRGVNLSSSIIKNLSRELTYTIAAPKTMLTQTGRELARNRSPKALLFFEELLEEFAYYDLGKFHVKEFKLNDKHEIILVIPDKCQKCNGEFSVQLSTEMGLKCEKAKAVYSCNKCNQNYKIEFCLPLISQK